MTYKTVNKQLSFPLSGSFTGSLAGTSSYAITASYALNNNGSGGGNSSFISIGSISASLNTDDDLFLIKSGSNNYFTINKSGSVTINSDASDVFIIKNSSNKNIFTVSQSGIVTVVTSSVTLTNPTINGSFYFDSSSFFVSLN